jgi:hypothetical protein
VRDAGAGDEALGPGQDDLVAVAPPPRGHRGGVRAGAGLGERVRHEELAATDPAGHLGLLGRVPRHGERDHAELGDERGERDAGRHASELLDQHPERERASTGAAVLLGVAHAHELVLDEHLVDVLGPLVGLVDLGRPGGDALLRDLPDERPELPELLGKLEALAVSRH